MPRPDRRIGRALAILWLMLAPVSAEAQDLDRLRTASLAGSERLRLRAFGDALERGVRSAEIAGQLRRDMTRQGYYHDGGGAEVVARAFRVAPLLAWDGNTNGGVLRDRFIVNGFAFEADPAYRAKSGLVVGGTAEAILRLAWAEGRIVQLQASAELAWSPRHRIGRGDVAVSACSRNHLAGWTFLDLCAAGFGSWRDLGSGRAHRLSADVSAIGAAGGALHEVGLSLQRASSTARDQNRVAVSVESIWRAAVTDVTMTLGAPVPGATVPRQRLDMKVTGLIAQRRWSLDVWRQRASGGGFLGVPRADRSWGIGLATVIRPGMSLRMGYADSTSTAPIATYSQITLDVRFDAFSR